MLIDLCLATRPANAAVRPANMSQNPTLRVPAHPAARRSEPFQILERRGFRGQPLPWRLLCHKGTSVMPAYAHGAEFRPSPVAVEYGCMPTNRQKPVKKATIPQKKG